jgi:hypothetical protein
MTDDLARAVVGKTEGNFRRRARQILRGEELLLGVDAIPDA